MVRHYVRDGEALVGEGPSFTVSDVQPDRTMQTRGQAHLTAPFTIRGLLAREPLTTGEATARDDSDRCLAVPNSTDGRCRPTQPDTVPLRDADHAGNGRHPTGQLGWKIQLRSGVFVCGKGGADGVRTRIYSNASAPAGRRDWPLGRHKDGSAQGGS